MFVSDTNRLWFDRYLDRMDEETLVDLIPFLVRHSLYASSLQKWLLEKCVVCEPVANEVFWCLRSYLDHDKHEDTNYVGPNIHEVENAKVEMVSHTFFRKKKEG